MPNTTSTSRGGKAAESGFGPILQFCFKLFNGGQALLQAFGKPLRKPILRDSDRLSKVTKCVFGYYFVFRLAEYDSDARLVVGVAKQVINGGEIKVHLSAELGFEVLGLEFDDHIGTQSQMVEEQINAEFLASHLERVLAADKREADPKLQEKVAKVIDKGAFQVPFMSLFSKGQEFEVVRVLENLLRKI